MTQPAPTTTARYTIETLDSDHGPAYAVRNAETGQWASTLHDTADAAQITVDFLVELDAWVPPQS